MKYIIAILGVFLFPLFTYANSQIDIETSATNINLGDTITITVSLSDIDFQQSNAEISLPGVENFDIFSQSVSNSFQNINGASQSLTQLTIQLTAKNTGNFEIGPVELQGDELIRDNEKINISVTLPAGNSGAWFNPEQKNNDQETEQNLTKDVLGADQEEDLGGLREVNFPLWAHGAFLIFFVGAFYLLLSYVLSPKAPKIVEKRIDTPVYTSSEYRAYFEKLSHEIGSIKSEDFFHQYNIGLRKIFGDQGVKKYYSATLSEFMNYETIKTDSKFELFKKSYKHEYSGVEVSYATQKKYIKDVLSFLP